MNRKAADLEPGMTVFDYDRQDKNRLVHSVMPGKKGQVVVRFGPPGYEPEPHEDEDGNDLGIVPADKEYDVIAGADGKRL